MNRRPCGTNAAYQWHVKHGEEPCGPCRDAHSAYGRAHRAGKIPPRRTAECGTQEGYMHHRFSDTPPCGPCLEVHAAHCREWRAKRKRAAALDAAWAEVLAETVGAA